LLDYDSIGVASGGSAQIQHPIDVPRPLMIGTVSLALPAGDLGFSMGQFTPPIETLTSPPFCRWIAARIVIE